MSERPFRSISWIVLLILSCSGEGAGRGPSETPDEPSNADVDDAPPPDEQTASAEPPDPCSTGTCVPCGDAVCLTGFYCEESVSACGWVPECADSPSCACLARALPDCSCEERASGVYVVCR